MNPLSPFSYLYSTVMDMRNWLYDTGVLSSYGVSCPVVSVGNITTGGTGKTPIIEHLLTWAQKNQISCGVVSRGYKRQTQGVVVVEPAHAKAAQLFGDEPTWLAERHPESLVVVGGDRVAAAQHLLKQRPVKLIVADDAFQHRRLKRDLNLVVIDAMEPIARYQVLPKGRLRESLRALARADFIILNKVNLVSQEEKAVIVEFLRDQLFKFNLDHVKIVHSRYELHALPSEIDATKGVVLVSGIAQPQSFAQLARQKIKILHHAIYPDHHDYTSVDVRHLLDQCNKYQVPILATEKDVVKLKNFAELRGRIFSSHLKVEFDWAVEKIYDHIRSQII